MPNDQETENETPETKEPEKTPAEIAAEEKVAAAERRAAEAEAEAARVKAEGTTQKPAKIYYSMDDFTDAQWSEVEAQFGTDRKTLLREMNLRSGLKAETESALQSIRAQYEVKEQFQEALDADPLSSKYKTEAKKFLADLPADVVSKDPKKWVEKAIKFAKSGVKLPTDKRKPDNFDTKETGSVKDKGADKGYSVEEREVIESHGRKVEDYDAIKHPYIKDGSIHKHREEAPRFGPK